MRPLLATIVCASLTFGVIPTQARAHAQTTAPPAPAPASATDEEAVEQAQAAWSRGGWAEVRSILEPVADDTERLTDARMREKALCLLADATVNDPELDVEMRRQDASQYLERLLDADPSWRLPPAIYSPELFELFADVQDQRSEQKSMQCDADRNACKADLAEANASIDQWRADYETLEQKYEDQEIEVRDRVARTRIFAAFPAGIGHFYNGEPGLGATFLATEAVLGLTGLTLILYRNIADGCQRDQGFQRGSLVCSNRDLDGIVRRRKVEEAMGWMFLGSIALDILIAQLRFRPYTLTGKERVPRRELDAQTGNTEERSRRRKRKAKPRAKVRPTGGGGPRGVGLGISVRF
ncbi:MAG: hypothetical protein AAF799_32015 [Myxococcota bacterium]